MVGFTATPKRGDNVGLDEIFQEVVFSMSIKKLVHRGFLVKPQGLHIKVGIDLKKVRSEEGDFKKQSLRKVMVSKRAREIVIDTIKRFANDRRGIIFSVDIEHSELLNKDMKRAGFSSDVVHAKASLKDRKERLEDFALGKVQFLINPMILTEGFDCPRADCMINAAPTRNRSLYIQKAGRVLRLHPDKGSALLIDFGTAKKKHRFVTAIDLMGETALRTITNPNELYPPKKEEPIDVELEPSHEKYNPLENPDSNEVNPSPPLWTQEERAGTEKQKAFIRKLSKELNRDVPDLSSLGVGCAAKIIRHLISEKEKVPITSKQARFLQKLSVDKGLDLDESKIYSLGKYEAIGFIRELLER